MCISKLMTPRIKGRGGLRANEATINNEEASQQQVHHEGTTRESTTLSTMHKLRETMKERNGDDSSSSSSSCEGHLGPPSSPSTSPEAYIRSDIVVTSKQLIGRGAYADVFEVNHIRPRRGCCGNGGACDDDGSRRISSSRRRIGRQQQPQKNRYVIKQLRETLLLDPQDFQQAVSSMVMEAEFLSQLDHRNILRLRGVSTETAGNSTRRRTAAAEDTTRGDVSLLRGEDHFIVLDKLDETLSQRILRWKKGSIANEMLTVHDHDGKQAKRNPKLHYAYQIALALDYMHKKNIIYRDLKPDNIGFKGDTVQLFDFGLCRELPRKDASSSDFFVMSGAGTRRYMCPECVLREPYNATCDTYSLSMVLHEILTLQKPYAGYRVSVHHDKVCVDGERPKLLRYWPKQLRHLLQESWEHDPRIRLTMDKVVSGLKPLLGTPVEMTMCAVERSFMAIHDMAGMFNLPQKQQQQKVHRNKMSATEEEDDDDARTESTVIVEVADSSS